MADGPLPVHYEPPESLITNPLYEQQQNPAHEDYRHPANPYHGWREGVFPFIFTTHRLTEHHTAGGMSRNLPFLSELQPEMFCEVSTALAQERGLENGGWATIVTARGVIEARVLVTDRMRPLRVEGRLVHQVGLPYHWGGNGISRGDSANDLIYVALDPNVHTQEKVGTCDVLPGRRPHGAGRPELVREYRRRAGLDERTTT